MDNRNKNDMSVDDLVKQLKLVLDINEDDTSPLPSDEIKDAVEDAEDSGDAEEKKPSVSQVPETVSEKVRMLDEFFDAEEEKKTRKKDRKKRRDKKKNREPAEPDDIIVPPVPEKKTELTADELNDFANEIGDMFSDPEPAQETGEKPSEKAEEKLPPEEKQPEEKQPEEKQPEEAQPAKPEPEKTAKAASQPEAEKDEDNDLDIRVVPVVSAADELVPDDIHIVPEDENEDAPAPDDTGDGPFVQDAFKKKNEEPEEGATRKFGATIAVPEKPVRKPANDEEQDNGQEALPDDIAGFDSLFSDMHKDGDDGYTSSDEAIMDAFGKMDESGKKDGKSPVRTFTGLSEPLPDEQDDDGSVEDEKRDERVRDYDEFTSFDQKRTFLDSFKRKYLSVRRAFVLSSVFAALVFLYECFSLAPDKFPYFCSPEHNPSVFILVDLQLFAFCAVFAVKYIINGLKGIFSGKATASSLGALAVIFTFVYGIIAAVTAKPVPHPVMSASALCIVMMLLAELRCVKRDTLNFRIVSSAPGKPRFVMESYTPRKNSEEEREFYDYVPEDPTMLRISKTHFVRGFVGSNLKTSSSKGYVNLMFPILALIFAGALAVVLIIRKDISSAINAAYTASALCTPAAVFAAITLPSYSCAKKTSDDDSCVISEAAAEEYADASVVTFEDDDVFPPSLDKITSVRLYNDSRMDHIMYVLTSLFRKIGGPLLTICENAAKEYNEFSSSVTIENAVEGGIEATVDAQKVYLGSAGYMGGKLDPKYTADDRQYDKNDKNRIMYMIINDIVCAKFYIEYEMDKDFVSVIKQLSTSTRCVAIRTLDPNIDTGLIKNRLDTEIYHCKIVRSRENERRKDVSKSSRGAIVSVNSVKALLRTLMLCDKTVYSSKINMVICFLAMVIGLLFSVVLISTKTYGSISALHVLAYQVLLCLVIRIVTKLNV